MAIGGLSALMTAAATDKHLQSARTPVRQPASLQNRVIPGMYGPQQTCWNGKPGCAQSTLGPGLLHAGASNCSVKSS